MATQTFQLDPNAAAYTDDQIVAKVNAASANITRASCVTAAARPIAALEIDNAALATGVAKANLDAMSATAVGYVKTSPTTGEFPVLALQRSASGELDVDYDDVAI